MFTCLITRAKDDAAETALGLQEMGLKTVIEPILSVEKIAVKVENKNAQTLVITSANACDAIINSGFALDTRIFAIGLQTARALLEHGYLNISCPKHASADHLLELILERRKPEDGRIMYFCGDSVSLDFKEELEKLGFEVEKILSYKIKWHNDFSQNFLQEINKNKIDFVLCYSQNCIINFHKLAKNNNLLEYFGQSKLLCLSDKIAETAKELGFSNLGDFSEISIQK